MTIKIVKVLVATVSLAALVLGTDPGMARGGGGGHGGGGHGGGGHGGGGHGGGGGHWGGGGHFGGAHFSGARFSGARMGRSYIGGRNFSRMSRGNFAHANAAHVHGLRAGALGSGAAWSHGAWNNGNWNHAWNHWGNNWRGGWNGWNGGCCGGWWFGGPVFWPFFAGDLLAFTFWPWGFYDPFWAYGNLFVWDAMFWPGPEYIYGPYGDVYGGYAYGPARTRVASRRVAPQTTASVTDSADLAQSCGGLAPGVTDLPIDKIQQSLRLNDDQLKSLNALKSASSLASDVLKASCLGEISMTPLGRLDTVQKRLDGMVQAWGVMRTPLDDFYNSLNDEQRQRFAALGPAASGARSSKRRGSASGDNLAGLCNSRTESFAQLPAQRVEQAVKPTQQQQGALEKLKAASTEAANQLQASCPAQSPQTPLDRFDAVGKRLDAMAAAVKTVRPALADFYSSLTDEQKARFNTLGPPQNTNPRQG